MFFLQGQKILLAHSASGVRLGRMYNLVNKDSLNFNLSWM